jgi:DNA helicase-4
MWTEILLGPNGIDIVGGGHSGGASYEDVADVRVRKGWLWNSIEVLCSNGRLLLAQGLSRGTAGQLAETARQRVADAARDRVRDSSAELSELLLEFDQPGGRRAYLGHAAFQLWSSRVSRMTRLLKPLPPSLPRLESILVQHDRLLEIVRGGESSRAARNNTYVREEALRHAKLFQSDLGHSLTPRQQEAILHDEDNCIVVAGAGTGKTSTIVGKCAYVVASGLAKPEQILLMAFTRKARDEMEERVKALGLDGVAVRTFHGLGMEVIANADGRKPSLSALAEDDIALKRWITVELREAIGAKANGPVTEFIAYKRYPYRPASDFKDQHAHIQYLNGHDVRTLQGEKVKSLEECLIANWLLLNGVRYEYERKYEHDTTSIQYRQYKPDFYLPDSKVYIEHFGVNKAGMPAPYINAGKYREAMAWKIELHRSKGTRLVQTFSYQKADGTLFAELERQLRVHGVVPRPLTPDALAEVLSRDEVVEPIAHLLRSFLSLFKGNCFTLEEARRAASISSDPARSEAFLKVFAGIHARYEGTLRAAAEIDFNDMINLAAERVEGGRFVSPYRYVLVDEFQDIGRGRARLLRALLDQVDDRRLFCVGDDWQSIYRFTGSDLSLMTKFEDAFGFTRRTDLDQTYRFNDKLLSATSKFVLQNPAQLRKTLVAARQSELPAIVILSKQADEEYAGLLRRVLDRIRSEVASGSSDVLVVGRYNHTLPEDQANLRREYPTLRLRFMTAHSAKGLEADYAVVLDVTAGKYGFPSEIVDDPILGLVMAGQQEFPNAEERRLFYVALSRAKHRTFILTDDHRRSLFVDELEGPEYYGLVIESGAATRQVACPLCEGGRLVSREGDFGRFWGCSNFPRCKAIVRTCPWCEVGAFVKGVSEYRCANEKCQRSSPVCPKCQTGAMVPRTGPYGPFKGCSEWRREGASCDYKTRSGTR